MASPEQPRDLALSAHRSADVADRALYLAFKLANETYAVPIAHVAEILKPTPITEVPRAPHATRGIISVRGRLVTVVDMRRRFELADQSLFTLEDVPVAARSRILITEVGGEPIGLLVDEVQQVFRLSADEIEPTQVLGNDQPAYIAGIGRPAGASDVLILLDLRPILLEPQSP